MMALERGFCVSACCFFFFGIDAFCSLVFLIVIFAQPAVPANPDDALSVTLSGTVMAS